MKISRWLWSIFVLSSLPSLARADEPSIVEWARRRVDTGLVKPLAKQEQAGSRFSRSRQPPRERRVRVTQSTASADKRGNVFVAFAIDVRFASSDWHQDDITGCAYRGSGELFVKNGDTYLPAAFLLGKDVEPVPGACEAAPPPA